MSAHSENSKEKKQIAVSKAVLEVIEREGLLGVTHSKVARKAKVSRAWIYEYIGKEKSALIEYAAEVFAERLSRTNHGLPKNKDELRTQIREATKYLFDSVTEDPVTMKLYFRYRGTDNPIGKVIKKSEVNWLKRAAQNAHDILGLPIEQTMLLAELTLTLRCGFAHRLATSDAPAQARERADMIFNFIYDALEGMQVI